MKATHRSFAFAAALLSLVSTSVFAAEFSVDPAHSSIGFKVRHFVSKVPGEFKEFEGTFAFDEKKPEASSAKFTIKTASVDTNNAKRDGHLRNPDFFDVEKHPTITFTSKKVTAAGKNKYKLEGDMTMVGVTKPVTFDVEYGGMVMGFAGKNLAGFTATGTVNRKDFGMKWNKALDNGGFVLGDDVEIRIELEAIQK